MVKVETGKEVAGILFEKGLINQETLSSVRLEQVSTGRPAEEIILERGLVSPKDLAMARAEFLGLPYALLSDIEIPNEILETIPESIANRYILIPFEKKVNALSVAMSDPLDLQVIEFLEKKTKLKIRPHLAEDEAIVSAIKRQYGKALRVEVTKALEEVEPTLKIEEQIKTLEKAEETIREAPVAKIISAILEYAAKVRASDVHIEPTEGDTRVRYRIDGILQERLKLPRAVHNSLISRVKILAGLKIDERRVPQDGRIKVQIADKEIDVRVATLPTVLGEKTAIRLLEAHGKIPDLPDLGLRGISLKRLEEIIRRPNGIYLVTGPTSSGKTVTLASCLSKVNSVRINIVTLEDPVEIGIPGVNQVQIHPQAGLTFATGLRSLVRQDPNVIMVGEIRDGETATLSIHAALTGHVVFSTLHTNSAAGAVPRLLDMGVEAFLLASVLIGVQAQRLVRKICPDCKEEYEAPDPIEERVRKILAEYFGGAVKVIKKGKLILYRGKGCEKCGHSGYYGRTGIFEILLNSPDISELMLEHKPTDQIHRKALEEGMLSLVQDGFLKAMEGITTVEEVFRVVEE